MHKGGTTVGRLRLLKSIDQRSKSSCGCRKTDYIGHRVSSGGLETYTKDLQSLVDLPFPMALKAMYRF